MANPAPLTCDRLVSAKERRELIPFSNVHWSRLEKAGLVPRRIHIGQHRIAWKLSELTAWIDAKAAERDARAKAEISRKAAEDYDELTEEREAAEDDGEAEAEDDDVAVA